MIGNLLVYPNYFRQTTGGDRFFQVFSLKEDSVTVTDGRITTNVSYDTMKYVPVTKEILEQFDVLNQLRIFNDKIQLVINNGECNVINAGNYHGSVTYMHELQNYIFWNFKFRIKTHIKHEETVG